MQILSSNICNFLMILQLENIVALHFPKLVEKLMQIFTCTKLYRNNTIDNLI